MAKNFQNALQYLTNEVLAVQRDREISGQSRSRNLSCVSSDRSQKRVRFAPSSHSGRFQRRGGRDGRGNRAGRFSDNRERFSQKEHVLLKDGNYPSHIWWNTFTADEQAYCMRLRNNRKNRDAPNNTTRNVSALNSQSESNGPDMLQQSNVGSEMSRRRCNQRSE